MILQKIVLTPNKIKLRHLPIYNKKENTPVFKYLYFRQCILKQ